MERERNAVVVAYFNVVLIGNFPMVTFFGLNTGLFKEIRQRIIQIKAGAPTSLQLISDILSGHSALSHPIYPHPPRTEESELRQSRATQP